MEFQDQSVNDLILNLSEYPIDVTSLQILSEREILNRHFKLKFGILGASHFVKVVNRDSFESLTEVFACVDLVDEEVIGSERQNSFSGITRYMSYPMKDHKGKDVKKGFNTFDYSFKSKVYHKNDKGFHFNFDNEIHKSRNHNGLSYSFPPRENDPFAPLTTVTVIFEEDEILISSLHAYPNEESIIVTDSKISKREKETIYV